MESQEPTGRADAWPPPHPSPPRPPPPGYGVPGTEPDLRWLWAVVGGLVAIGLFAGGGVWLLSGSGENEPAAAATPTTTPTGSPSSEPEPATPSPAAVSSAPPAAQVRCWDASTAARVEDCSLPAGAAGLAWVFPQLVGQQCRPPQESGPGVVVRVLCTATLPDGTTVQIGYYQWESVAAGDAYYGAQGMIRRDRDGFQGWVARLGQRTKKAVLYAEAPYSRTLVFRTASAGSAELRHLQPRPPGRLRGEPVG